jgi:hypothetical protein
VELLPNVKDSVVLRDSADREYVSRVENLGASLLVVTRPHDLPAEEAFGTGTELGVVWADSDGVVRAVPTRIMAEHAEGTVQLWSLFVTGPAFVAQRRRHVRVAADGPVELRPAGGQEIDVVTGSLIDVSEGAVRCTVEAGAADGFLGSRNEAIAEFCFGTVDFAVPGRVEFLRSTSRPAEFEDLVVLFDEPVADLESLREQIFAQQVLTAEDNTE